MQTRTIVITLGAALVAFAAAFGIAKATSGSDTPTANAAPAAQTFDVPSAKINAGAPEAGLPALKPKPKPKPKATPTPPPTSTTPPPTNTTPPPQNTTPPPVTGGESPVTGGEQPVSGGGEG